MAVLVIAGSGRSAGKTAVGCALVQALAGFCWTAVKITPHLHGHVEPVWEEQDATSSKDTGRYLAAGAKHAYMLEGSILHEDVMAKVVSIRDRHCLQGILLIESNRLAPDRVARSEEPSLCLTLLRGPIGDWKSSLQERAVLADALVLTGGFCCDELPSELRGKRAFQLPPGRWSSPELVGFVQRNLIPTSCTSRAFSGNAAVAK
jgi:hypothetical protein